MSKYEVGNKVLLRKDLEVGELYKDCSLTKSMKQYLGKEAIIKEVDYDGDYKIDLDDGEWCWTDDMIEKKILQVGDKVRIKEDLTTGYDYEIYVNNDMISYKGKIATIKYANESNDTFFLDIDGQCQRWEWSEDMFDLISNDIKEEVKDEVKDESSSKLKVGTCVLIKDDLREGNDYEIYVNSCMEDYSGKFAKITGYTHNDHYALDVDDGEWHWTEDMFEVVDFTLVNVLKFIKDGMSLVNEDGSKVITCKDGVVYTKGFNGEFDLEEVFYVAEVLTLIEILNKKYVEKQITMYMENEGSQIVTLKDDLDIYDEDGIDVTELYYIKDLLGATFSIKL